MCESVMDPSEYTRGCWNFTAQVIHSPFQQNQHQDLLTGTYPETLHLVGLSACTSIGLSLEAHLPVNLPVQCVLSLSCTEDLPHLSHHQPALKKTSPESRHRSAFTASGLNRATSSQESVWKAVRAEETVPGDVRCVRRVSVKPVVLFVEA